MPRITLNVKGGSQEYLDRKTAKAVIYDKQNLKVLLINNLLIGGGLEKEETYPIAIKREAMEEAGVTIQIVKELGQVIQYRDFLKKKYIVKGFFCLYIKTVAKPFTYNPEEKKLKLSWKRLEPAIRLLEKEVAELLKEGSTKYIEDEYQAHLLNRQTSLLFLNEAAKLFNGANNPKKKFFP